MLTLLNRCSQKTVNGHKNKKKSRQSLLFFLIPLQYLLYTFAFFWVLLLTPLSVKAEQTAVPEPVPRYLITEELISSLAGAYVGGLFGYTLAIYLSQNFQLLPCGENMPFFGSRCEGPPLIGTMVGSSLGASMFLILATKKLKIRGNTIAAFVGAGFGAWIGMIFADEYNVAPWFPLITVFIVATPSGILIVPFFNLGATMEVSAMNLASSGVDLVSARLRW